MAVEARTCWVTSTAAWLAVAVGCSVITSSVDEIPDLGGEWTEAQNDIAQLVPPVAGDPYSVTMSRFVVKAEEQPFYCADYGIHAVILVKGCFRAEPDEDSLGVIRYVLNTGNLRHEARHAILFALGDERWPSVGH